VVVNVNDGVEIKAGFTACLKIFEFDNVGFNGFDMGLLLHVDLFIFFHEPFEFFLTVKLFFERDTQDLQILVGRRSVQNRAVTTGFGNGGPPERVFANRRGLSGLHLK
jgi:hypothetical protein